MKLTQLMKENEERPLSTEVKKHFLEIVSTYNKYQESMDRKSDITQVAETLGGITEAARTLAIREAGDWFDKHTVKRNMSELDKLGKQFDKVALEARALDQRMAGLYEDMGHILSRYYKFGEITEDEMKSRLGINETKEEDCGCDSINEVSDSEIKKIIKKKAKCGPYTVVVQSGNYDKHITHGKDVGNNIDKAIKVYHQFKKKHRVGVQIIDGYGKTVFFESVNEANNDEKYVVIAFHEKGGGFVMTRPSSKKDAEDSARSITKSSDITKQKAVKVSDARKIRGLVGKKYLKESINEQPVTIHNRTSNGNIVTTLKESDLNEQETALYEFGKKFETLMEKNCPTDSSKWSSYKSQAKKKFKVYPSAYANGWAAKKYKAAGGGWKKC